MISYRHADLAEWFSGWPQVGDKVWGRHLGAPEPSKHKFEVEVVQIKIDNGQKIYVTKSPSGELFEMTKEEFDPEP